MSIHEDSLLLLNLFVMENEFDTLTLEDLEGNVQEEGLSLSGVPNELLSQVQDEEDSGVVMEMMNCLLLLWNGQI